MSDVPTNIQEFNTIAGLIFAQLHRAFPVVENIDRGGIAGDMGVEGPWVEHRLPSGGTFNEVLAHTIGWLNHEGYVKAYGSHPAANVLLTAKGLAAMSAVPSGLKDNLGTELRRSVEQPHLDLSGIGELIVASSAASGRA
jgi:hypothetical protein